MKLGTNGDVLPATCGSNSNYNKAFADYGSVSSGAGGVACRSYFRAYLYGGLACLIVDYDAGITLGSIGSRLLYKGDYSIVNNL